MLKSPKLLSDRARINYSAGELYSVRGAEDVISTIKSRRAVTSLILGNNHLGDDGCIILFAFLRSPIGRQYHISEISLNSNRIGDKGLLAIAEYLVDNQHLKELFLQNNEFSNHDSVVTEFATAVNSSRLQTLSLATNKHLSDRFLKCFLPLLTSVPLCELHLSAIGLSPASLPDIVAFVTRCQLRTFKCNANSLGAHAVRSIIQAIEEHNHSLLAVELYSNQLTANPGPDSDTDELNNPGIWRLNEARLRRVLGRNEYLKRETEQQALCLLRYSRPLLMRSSIALNPASPSEHKPTTPSTILPIEIQHYILSFFAPILSTSQRIRIYNYASDSATLPQLLPRLPRSGFPTSLGPNSSPGSYKLSLQRVTDSSSSLASIGKNDLCVPDPSNLSFGVGQAKRAWSVGTGSGCAAGSCLGTHNSILCHREQDRVKWLELVGCTMYDANT